MSKSIWSQIVSPVGELYKKYPFYIIVGGAIICWGLSFAFNDGHKFSWKDSFMGMAKLLAASAAFSVILKSIQFSEIFHGELRKIIYSEEYLDKRVDVTEIWIKITKVLCKQRFDGISSKVFGNVLKHYLPKDHDYYYNNTEIELFIELDKNNTDYLLVTETYKAVIMAEEGEEVPYKFYCGIDVVRGEENITNYELLEFKVNGKDHPARKECEPILNGNLLEAKSEIKLIGRKNTIVRKEKKRYSIKTNCHKRYLAVWLYNNFTVTTHCPPEINVEFFNIGTLNEFSHTTNIWQNIKTTKSKCSGLIYKNQGLMLYLYKN